MTTTPTDPTTLPVSQAARFLGVHPHTLRAWADQGRLPYLRLNARGDRRFRVDDLRTFQAAASRAATRMTTRAPSPRPVVIASVRQRTRASVQARTTDWEAQIDPIAKLGTRLNHLSSVAEIGAAICAELRQFIDYHNVRVYRVRGDDVVPVAWHGNIGEYTDETVHQLQVHLGEGITGWVALHGQPVYLSDAAHDPRAMTMPDTEDELDESMLVAPMLYEDRAIGVIVLSKMGLDRFASHDLRYLGIYASIAAQAMVNADISERLRAQQETLDQQMHSQRELLRVTEAILTNLDPAAVIAEVADTIGGLIPVDTLGVYVHEPSQRLLTPMLARGVGAEAFLSRRLPDTGEVVAEVLASGDARSVRRAGSDPAALIIAPLRGRDRVLGILYLKRLGAAAHFERGEEDLVRLFAAHASIALQNALTHRAVEIRAQMDALTGLRNHGTFREELGTAVTQDAPFALLMLDLDDFKAYNDRHGHEAGNELLKSIAAAIRNACRMRDLVYRYGGDEFSLILPDTGLPGAVDVAERVRVAIREARASGRRRSGIRCSIGVATFPADGDQRADLLLAADRALYAAKRAGRDRVATSADGLALADDFVPPSTPVEESLVPSLG